MMLHRHFTVVAVAVGIVCFLTGCTYEARHVAASLGSSSKPYQEFLEDPVTLTTIKTVAVFPFADRAPQPGFDTHDFANKLANQLASKGKVRVIYPRDILEEVERENQAARRHNARLKERLQLGLFEADENAEMLAQDPEAGRRGYYDPIKNVDEAIRLARRAKADAIIVGEVSDFDPYMRPRMSVSMRLIATGSTETAARAIAEMTQWGIPRATTGGASGGGTIYVRQQTFDSSIGSVGMDVSKYGLTHLVDAHPYDTEVYIRSMSKYYDVVAHELASAYMEARKKAVKEAEDRAKAQAKQNRQDERRAQERLLALIERDSRIPDYETDARGEAYFDQAFMDKNQVLRNGGDRRIQSWRPEGRSSRVATTAERWGRDALIPENERGRGLDGYSTMVDSSFPDADAMMEMNMGDNRDRSWRPDYYNRANPEKSAPLYDRDQFVGR
ncbi:MAG: hypothetical protein LIQ30_05315 [Planctomycetes bacterium]|nr:hypothetical protein [Planctomycetota bacterium]MCD7896564.1 hypothetical protein [Planctomycetaceae bacterium]